ncbi:MAG: hypothetical protein QM664_13615 [Flavihumibacter sp.]
MPAFSGQRSLYHAPVSVLLPVTKKTCTIRTTNPVDQLPDFEAKTNASVSGYVMTESGEPVPFAQASAAGNKLPPTSMVTFLSTTWMCRLRPRW